MFNLVLMIRVTEPRRGVEEDCGAHIEPLNDLRVLTMAVICGKRVLEEEAERLSFASQARGSILKL